MAYSTGSYTGVDNALALFYAWAATNGWTQNFTGADGTGTRAHISKTINGLDCFFNLRSATAETLSPLQTLTGIAVNGSTAWDGSGTSWNRQTGFTTSTYGGTSPAQGCVDKIKASGGTYYFFSTNSTLSAVFETDSAFNDWRMLTVGNVGGTVFYSASGGDLNNTDTILPFIFDQRSAYMARMLVGGSVSNYLASAYIAGEGWYNRSAGSSGQYEMGSLLDNNYSASSTMPIPAGSLAGPIVAYSPDSFRGNAQLAPSQIVVTKGISNKYWPIGEIEGVKFVNMTNYSSGEEITYGTGTYKLFKVFNSPYAPGGVAFLK